MTDVRDPRATATGAGDCEVSRCPLLSRREFVERAVAASVVIGLGACGDGVIGGLTGPSTAPPVPGGSLVIALADFPALANVGGIARVDGGLSTPIAVSRVAADSFVAFSMICPHAGYRPISIVADGFYCPNHGAQFEADGDWRGGQRTRDLVRYDVLYDDLSETLTIS